MHRSRGRLRSTVEKRNTPRSRRSTPKGFEIEPPRRVAFLFAEEKTAKAEPEVEPLPLINTDDTD